MITNNLLPEKLTTTIGKFKTPFNNSYIQEVNVIDNLNINKHANIVVNGLKLNLIKDSNTTNIINYTNNIVSNIISNKVTTNLILSKLTCSINKLNLTNNITFMNIPASVDVTLPKISSIDVFGNETHIYQNGFTFLIFGKGVIVKTESIKDNEIKDTINNVESITTPEDQHALHICIVVDNHKYIMYSIPSVPISI